MIRVEHLYKFWAGREVLRDVSFTVAKGEVLGLLGLNGSGKTTTLRVLAGGLRPDSGQVHVAGVAIGNGERNTGRQVGYLPERLALYDELSVAEHLRFMAALWGFRGRSGSLRVSEVCEQFGLTGAQHTLCRHLSRGFRQRVGLAQALLHKPSILLLDEPSNGLDAEQVRQLRSYIADLRGRCTVVLSTHVLGEAHELCDRVVILSHGEVAAESRGHSEAQLESMVLECIR